VQVYVGHRGGDTEGRIRLEGRRLKEVMYRMGTVTMEGSANGA
jgi:hypothetical protein